jgi:hypothetical protein
MEMEDVLTHKILYVGSLASGATSTYRYHALKRLQQEVIPFEWEQCKYKFGIMNSLVGRFPVGPLVSRVNADLVAAVEKESPDIVWFDKPIRFTPATIRRVKELGAFTICYNQDSPFGPRNDGCWYQFNKVYREFDLNCLFRNSDVLRYKEWGLNYIKTQFSYDPQQDVPPPGNWSDADRTREVSFIGSPHDERSRFLRDLIETHKLPVVISGPSWEKVFSKTEMASYTRGGMLRDAEYREAIWKSKINLAFITHSNEDDVAHKAFEIAACRSFLLAERSADHQAAFEEGKEAEFFSSVEECAEKIRYYLGHPAEREEIAMRGWVRANRSGYDNDTQLSRILKQAEQLQAEAGKLAEPGSMFNRLSHDGPG